MSIEMLSVLKINLIISELLKHSEYGRTVLYVISFQIFIHILITPMTFYIIYEFMFVFT